MSGLNAFALNEAKHGFRDVVGRIPGTGGMCEGFPTLSVGVIVLVADEREKPGAGSSQSIDFA